MMYTYGIKLGVKQLMHGQLKPAVRHLLMPTPYWRFLEYGLVRGDGDFKSTDTILDIGSPKLLSIYLAKKLGAEVYSTDIEDYFVPEFTALRDWEGLSPKRFHVEVEDGRRLSFPDNFFNKVFSISVVEHIPDDGDSECLKEIGRVLAPGGRCLITTPFWPTSKRDYKPAGAFYWARSSSVAEDGKVFFQRRYSESDLHERLIKPSGLRLRKLQYVGEKVFVRSQQELFEHIPGVIAPLIGPIQPIMSMALHTRPVDSWREVAKPLCAFIVLEKPA